LFKETVTNTKLFDCAPVVAVVGSKV